MILFQTDHLQKRSFRALFVEAQLAIVAQERETQGMTSRLELRAVATVCEGLWDISYQPGRETSDAG